MIRKSVHIVGAARTSFGKLNGRLSHIRPDDLAADLLKQLLYRNNINPIWVDRLIIGCSNQAGEDNRNIARMVSILSGLPFETHAVTLNSLCTSGLESIIQGARCIALGEADLIVCGGVESMSRSPLVTSSISNKTFDSTIGWRFVNPKMSDFCPTYSMPQTAEWVCSTLKLDKNKLDDLAFESRERYEKAIVNKIHQQDIISHSTELVPKPYIDEPHRILSRNLMNKLPFIEDTGRYITLGNAARIGDGAGLVLLASDSFIHEYGVPSLAKVEQWTSVACHPNDMAKASTTAIQKLIKEHSLDIHQIDAIEHAESFSLQTYLISNEFKFHTDRINRHGSNISTGNPISAGPMRAMVRMTHLIHHGLENGLVTSSAGLGQGTALLLKKV